MNAMGVDVSVVVVSRGRPDALGLCLTALGQQDAVRAEVIVVACEAGLRAVARHPLGAHVTAVPCGVANISVARNLGWACARFGVVAFVDDDAVPEPTWLARLIAPFGDLGVQIAGGRVLGRNGITQQWGDRALDDWGRSHAFDAGLRRRVEGTNMALRRELLQTLGGFDPAFRFYHDETDVIWRARLSNEHIVYVPQAVV
ncbi:MAG: glycosyltransferase family 2 protein, partial [Paracoccaceae bacterium]